MVKDLSDIVRAYAARSAGGYALATLVRAHGSSYRRPGARMLMDELGPVAGSLSAGCLEDEVAVAAREVIATGAPKLMLFDTRRRFGCHGSIEIFVERVGEELLVAVRDNVNARRSFLLATNFETPPLGTRIVTDESGEFVQRIEPAIHLLIIGSGPDAAALRSQARLLGWESTAVESISEWNRELDTRTAAVIATHNYGRDCAALRHLLPRALAYVGVIGPRRRRDELLGDVLDAGAVVDSNLFAPAGLDLGAETPEEIALSIVSEIQHVFAGGSGESLRDSKLPIHHASSRDHSGGRSVVASR
ncbi:MAG TPA: XdhC family protein [Chthoniobacterales bacterium]|nr:XdhC family protein [Chthoniobacterales bacterium]